MSIEGAKKGGRYTYKEPSKEEFAGAIFAAVDGNALQQEIEDFEIARMFEAGAEKLLASYEIRQRLLDGKPVKRDNKDQ